MEQLSRKFQQHATVLQKRLDKKAKVSRDGDDTLAVSFLCDKNEYTVTVTSNSRTLSASLWAGAKCVATVEGEDGVLFVKPIEVNY